MRSPDRIDQLLSRLRELWLNNPDLRLAQLLVILANPVHAVPEVFHLEDAALLARIEAMLAAVRGPR